MYVGLHNNARNPCDVDASPPRYQSFVLKGLRDVDAWTTVMRRDKFTDAASTAEVLAASVGGCEGFSFAPHRLPGGQEVTISSLRTLVTPAAAQAVCSA
jgi:hypothetical protein